MIFTDEWGGGGRPRCRAYDPLTWGADAIYDIKLPRGPSSSSASHYKMPAPQLEEENCVAHNGSIVPVPGRDIFVQAWYQGGISVVDFTDSANPVEIAYFDRGPVHAEDADPRRLLVDLLVRRASTVPRSCAGSTCFEADAQRAPLRARTRSPRRPAGRPGRRVQSAAAVRASDWPAEPVVARAYLDQLARGEGLPQALAADLTAALDRSAARLEGGTRDGALAAGLESLAAALEKGSGDAIAQQRRAALGETLSGIAARLR